jgi:hypothetical protein
MTLNSKVILAILLGLVLVNSSVISNGRDERESGEKSERKSENNSERREIEVNNDNS